MDYALLYVLLAYATWIFFLAVMSLKAARDEGKLTRTSRILGIPLLFLGLLLDFSLNLTSSIIFLDLPQEWLLTIRCDRYLGTHSGWRYSLAKALCRNLLDPFQVGGHCH